MIFSPPLVCVCMYAFICVYMYIYTVCTLVRVCKQFVDICTHTHVCMYILDIIYILYIICIYIFIYIHYIWFITGLIRCCFCHVFFLKALLQQLLCSVSSSGSQTVGVYGLLIFADSLLTNIMSPAYLGLNIIQENYSPVKTNKQKERNKKNQIQALVCRVNDFSVKQSHMVQSLSILSPFLAVHNGPAVYPRAGNSSCSSLDTKNKPYGEESIQELASLRYYKL